MFSNKFMFPGEVGWLGWIGLGCFYFFFKGHIYVYIDVMLYYMYS